MKQVFYINNDALFLIHWDRKGLTTPIQFDHTPEGILALTDFLSRHPKVATKILVDVIEEDFRREHIRSMRQSDRIVVAQRFLQRHFRDSEGYTHATYQGKSLDTSGQDNILYSGITNAEQINQWLQPFIKYDIPISGIWSVPLMVPLLRKHLPENKIAVLVFQQSKNALRQVLMIDGHVVTSRLTKMPHKESSMRSFFIEETERMLHFYRRKRFIPYNETIDVIFFHADELDISELGATNESYRVTFRNLINHTSASISDDDTQNLYAALWFAWLVSRLPPKTSHYQPQHIVESYRLYNAARILCWSGAVIFCLAVLTAQALVFDSLSRQKVMLAAQKETKNINSTYTLRYQPLEQLLQHTNEFTESVKLSQQLTTIEYSNIQDDFVHVSQILSQPEFSDITLIALSWQQTLNDEQGVFNLDIPPAITLEIEGQIPIKSMDTREAVRKIESLVTTLKSPKFNNINTIKPPLEYRSEQQLRFLSEPDSVIYLSEGSSLGIFKLALSQAVEQTDE